MSRPDDAEPIRRPRVTQDRELEVLTAVMDVLREVGYEALTMDQVAARARCSKATLYRQWQDKPRMVATALYATRPFDLAAIDTGSLRGDLLTFAGDVAAHAERDTALIAALGHAVLVDPQLADAVRVTLLEPETAALRALVERAVTRGEIRADAAVIEFIPQLLFGAVTTCPLFRGAHADLDYLTRFVDAAILAALNT